MWRNIKQSFRSKTVRLIAGLAGGNVLGLAVGVIGTLIQACFVGPADLGFFRQFAIISGYCFILHLGLFGALQRVYPYYIGKGEPQKAIAVAEVCQVWHVVVSALICGGLTLVGLVYLVKSDWRSALGWFAQAFNMGTLVYGNYLLATYRSGSEFTRMAKASVISSFAGMLAIPVFFVAPYFGMALRQILSLGANLFYLHKYRPLKIRWRFDWGEWRDLAKQGIPMFAAGYGRTVLWSTTETLLVAKALGPNALGLLGMGIMVLEMAIKLPQAIVAVYTPRLIEHYGRTHDSASCLRLCLKPVVLGIIVLTVLALTAPLVLPWVVPLVMPKYGAAIPTISLLLLILPLTLLDLPYAILVAVGDRVKQNVAVYVGLAVFILLALGAIHMGYGLTGVVAASLVGRAVTPLVVMIFLLQRKAQALPLPPAADPNTSPDKLKVA